MLKSHQDRHQFQMLSLESAVASESLVRVIDTFDTFVDLLDLTELGFTIKRTIKNGAPAFHAGDLLQIYYYGYLNRVRSSRRLEREALTNLEAIWLPKGRVFFTNFRQSQAKKSPPPPLPIAILRGELFNVNRPLNSKKNLPSSKN